MKKVTIKDIAKEANVSTATVSYILNNVPKQTITDETRCRVLAAVERLNYVPNLAARSLVKRKTGLIGILINRAANEPWWRQLRYADMVNRLEQLLTERGYHVVLSSIDAEKPKVGIIAERKLDGVFLFDVKEEHFYSISHHFPAGVPLVVIDSLVEDTLFYKVIHDYEFVLQSAQAWNADHDCYYVIEPYYNEPYVQAIKDTIGVEERQLYVMEDEAQLAEFINSQPAGSKGIIFNEFIGALAAKYTDSSHLTIICTMGCSEIVPAPAKRVSAVENKSQISFDLMMQLLKQDAALPNDKYIKVK
ncbi:LacI family transcriptional regulator [Paenibacillus sp. SC116]|uniref:LacI family DNA-binding transcriptional regulator n=1 Tax=Paenibacillus sp. SC116 TaxID=2968986 RepID=UPI00215AC773|nr:LacI family DNA-binding transcriptional regulator [Paenibacillus sp. SC116]MCR8842245.1 LacI family transcriptional regulator [Paenibacillus sp. SC116]